MRKRDDAEDYNFLATVQSPGETVRRVLCRLWRPRQMTDWIRLAFYPTARQAEHHFKDPNPFSLKGRIIGESGHTVTIRATEAWVESIPTRSLGKKRRETVFLADPIDLQILVRMRPDKKTPGPMKAYINYVITPAPKELSPFTVMTYMGNGAVQARTARRFSFTLKGGRRLKFLKRYHHENRGDEDVTWHELVATEKRSVTLREFGQVDQEHLDELDDFLLLVSFAARFRVVCVGIDAYSESADHFTFYRKNRTVPKATDQDTNDAVIDRSDFEVFIRKAYDRFIASGKGEPDELLRHAVQLVMPHEDRTVESEFTTLYAALETLVLLHRRAVGMEFVIEDRYEWMELRKDLEKFLKSHRLLNGESEKRKLIYGKLEELRRVSFATAFQRFCGDHHLNVDDLWPVIGRRGEMSLSEIRNHIVHGSALKWSQWLALADARDHLRWTVERMLLSVLGWPVEKSKVRPEWLATNRPAMIDLMASRHAMRGVPNLPDGVELVTEST